MPRRKSAKSTPASAPSTVEGSDDAGADVAQAKEQAPEETAPDTTTARPPGRYRVARDGEPVRCGGWVRTERGWVLERTE